MNNPRKILKWSLFAGAVYFILVAAVHFSGLRIPGLYIYYDIPSMPYQDRIIGLLAFGWSMFLYSGYRLAGSGNTRPVRYILFAGIVAVICLLLINNSGEIKELASDRSRWIYMTETLFLFAYSAWLVIFYVKCRRKDP